MSLSIFSQLNYLAIFIGFFLHILLGIFWYSPTLFGKNWQIAKGLDDSELKNSTQIMSYSTISSLTISFCLNFILKLTLIEDFLGVIFLAVILFLLVSSISFYQVIFDKTEMLKQRLTVFVIDSGYTFIAFLSLLVIFYFWK
jgi:hypothetical protein